MLLIKYGRSDLGRAFEADRGLVEERAPDQGGGDPAELAQDLEKLGPTFIKIGQLLSTRADLLPAPYLSALARLQDRIEPSRACASRAT